MNEFIIDVTRCFWWQIRDNQFDKKDLIEKSKKKGN
jgi:hypothetical protein